MALTEVESTIRPFQCPVCTRFFYFENDYINHKCKGGKKQWIGI